MPVKENFSCYNSCNIVTGRYNYVLWEGGKVPDTRSQILITMARLIEKQGYHATGLNEIIRESGTPKGSLYYYFPDGKEQIGAEAILESGKVISTRLRGLMET